REPIKIAGCERVKFMVVTLRATEGGSHPDGRGRADAVRGVFSQVFFVLDASLSGDAVQPVVTRGNALFASGSGKQVSGELFAGKAREGIVLVERLNDIIAVRPHA